MSLPTAIYLHNSQDAPQGISGGLHFDKSCALFQSAKIVDDVAPRRTYGRNVGNLDHDRGRGDLCCEPVPVRQKRFA